MKLKTNIKGGRLAANHNETRTREAAKGLRVRTGVQGGRVVSNHNETPIRVGHGLSDCARRV